ncbi:hypothetical protein D3C71_1564840 [compost metagenome]
MSPRSSYCWPLGPDTCVCGTCVTGGIPPCCRGGPERWSAMILRVARKRRHAAFDAALLIIGVSAGPALAAFGYGCRGEEKTPRPRAGYSRGCEFFRSPIHAYPFVFARPGGMPKPSDRGIGGLRGVHRGRAPARRRGGQCRQQRRFARPDQLGAGALDAARGRAARHPPW